MRMVAVFAAGVAATVTAEVLVAWLLVVNGALPINADAMPPKLERWAARTALIAGVERQMEHHKKNPVSGSFALLSWWTDGIIGGGGCSRFVSSSAAVCQGWNGGRSIRIHGLGDSPRHTVHRHAGFRRHTIAKPTQRRDALSAAHEVSHAGTALRMEWCNAPAAVIRAV